MSAIVTTFTVSQKTILLELTKAGLERAILRFTFIPFFCRFRPELQYKFCVGTLSRGEGAGELYRQFPTDMGQCLEIRDSVKGIVRPTCVEHVYCRIQFSCRMQNHG